MDRYVRDILSCELARIVEVGLLTGERWVPVKYAREGRSRGSVVSAGWRRPNRLIQRGNLGLSYCLGRSELDVTPARAVGENGSVLPVCEDFRREGHLFPSKARWVSDEVAQLRMNWLGTHRSRREKE